MQENRWKALIPYLLTGIVASGLVLSALAEFHKEITDPWFMHFDQWATQQIHQHASLPLTRLMFAFSFIGSVEIYFPLVVICAVVVWLAHRRREALLIFIAVVGSALLTILLKLHFRRLRPNVPWALAHEHSFSFPSGHSVSAFALYGIVTYLLMAHIRNVVGKIAVLLVAIFFILGIGASRIYLGVHYPSDVAAGYLVGFIWLSAVIASDLRTSYIAKKKAVSATL